MPAIDSSPKTLVEGELSSLIRSKNLRNKAIVGLEECLDAKMTMKNDEGKIVEYTDFRTILGAITLILAYSDGKPVERREIVTRNMTSLQDLQDKAKKSPELRAAIEELLKDAEKPVRQVAKSGSNDVSTT